MRAAALFLIAAIVFAGVFFGFGIGRHGDPMMCKAQGRALTATERRERLLRSAYGMILKHLQPMGWSWNRHLLILPKAL